MKSTSVDYITSNEQHVRMMIYDGDLPLDQAKDELLRIERAQRAAEVAELKRIIERLTVG